MLTISDLSYNIYLLIISIYDQVYRQNYLENDSLWRTGKMCFFLGVLSSMACSTSMLSLLIITFEKLAAVKNYYRFLHLNYLKTFSLIGFIFVISLSFCILPHMIYEKFSSRYPLCFSLHVTNQKTDGWIYSFLIFSIIPMIIIIIIIIFYVKIFRCILKSCSILSKEITINRLLKVFINALLVVTTNILTWTPVFFVSIAAAFGKSPLVAKSYQWLFIIILPMNSVLNPIIFNFFKIKEFYMKTKLRQT